MAKNLSLKLDEVIYQEAEKILTHINIPRNRYINLAVDCYNKFYKRQLLKRKLEKESKMVASNSMEILKEFEALMEDYNG
ncbi:MAG: hypothetical protein ABII90_11535 [Bacteroidota bacterium]